MTDSNAIQISFLGGASAIGASCAFVRVADTHLLVDCGVRFRAGNALPDLAQLSGERLDAILVTHAHSDHTGGLPVVCDAFPETPVYATPPTIDLIHILTRDALKIMNAADRETELPLYRQHQVDRLMANLRPAPRGRSFAIGEVEVTYVPASHILGASMIHLATPGGNALFTGDYSVGAQLTVPGLTRPQLPVDLVITESTYGDRLHEDRSAAEARLVAQIAQTVEAGGRVLIPVFAIGRAQEILLIIKNALRRGQLPEVPVFVDGMVRAVCDVYGRHAAYTSRALAHDIRRADHPFYTNGIRAVGRGDRRAALDCGACVFVASSGMLSGGASVGYATALAPRAEDAILITGYQDEESPGRALLALTEASGPRTLRLGDATVDVRCRFDKYGLSAHADRMQMVGLIESLKPRSVALVHGDAGAKRALADSLGVRDITFADDGTQLSRRYPRRHVHQPRETEPGEADVHALRHLLGPPQGRPVSARKVAEAWYGRRVPGSVVHAMADRIEALGLARRDDERRGSLWVLAPDETERFADEAELEAELKRDNPKGRLFELCMRMRIAPPLIEIEVEGAFHVATMRVVIGGEVIASGGQRAASRKAAVQLAARELLEVLEQRRADAEAAVTRLDDDAAAALQQRNPKGRLLEWFAGRHLPGPTFEHKAMADGYAARALCRIGERAIEGGWFGARSRKLAEHAAADALMAELPGDAERDADAGDADAGAADAGASGSSEFRGKVEAGGKAGGQAAVATDARMVLNEMRQSGAIVDFGYELRAQQGPSHQPLFVVEAWAQAPSGERIRDCQGEARSKKDAQRIAAAALLERIHSLQIER